MSVGKIGSLLVKVLVVGLFFVVTGCTHDITNDITRRMVVDDIYNDYKVQPKNSALDSKCATPPSVKIVNAEERAGDVRMYQLQAHSYTVKPREVVDSAASYLKAGYEKSGIKADPNSAKTLEMKLISLQVIPGMWTIGSDVRIQVSIPGKNLFKVYEGVENGMNANTLLADSIHLITRQIIEDQAIQDYILCR
jgi:hypothetical protein